MIFRDFLNNPSGVRYCYDNLKTASSYTLRYQADKEMMTAPADILDYYRHVQACLEDTREQYRLVESLKIHLCSIRDINGTISRLKAHQVLDDVELFEIKSLTLLSDHVARICRELKYGSAMEKSDLGLFPDLSEVLAALDPDHQRVPSFYIYDSYSEELREARRRYDNYKGDDKENLLIEIKEIEDVVRKEICESISDSADRLSRTLSMLAETDLFFAKAQQILDNGYSFPEISYDDTTTYRKMFHPKVKDALALYRKEFYPIDLSFCGGVTSIIGANMGGKTIVLKMLAMNQILFQFGFGIPAEHAVIAIKENVLFAIGDGQDDSVGISSFAFEMKSIDNIIKHADQGGNFLALIDEPARTTNPIEGAALVKGLFKRLENKHMSIIVTTHYNVEYAKCRRYRVTGLVDGKMDYSLTETDGADVPHEALDIALSLNIDKEWLKLSKEMLPKAEN